MRLLFLLIYSLLIILVVDQAVVRSMDKVGASAMNSTNRQGRYLRTIHNF